VTTGKKTFSVEQRRQENIGIIYSKFKEIIIVWHMKMMQWDLWKENQRYLR
jgi:hypothetical protein